MKRAASRHSGHRSHATNGLTPFFSAGVLCALLAASFWFVARWVAAESPPEKKQAEPQAVSLEVWGNRGNALKGSDAFRELASYGVDAKGRRTTEKVLVEISDPMEFYADSPIRMEDLKPGDEIWLFGKAVQREVLSKRGAKDRSGADRVIQAVRAILAGEALSVNASYADPKDPGFKWLKATVSDSSGGLRVHYQGQEYRVTLEKDAPILRRSDCPKKLLKSGIYVQVFGEKRDPPESAAKTKSSPKLTIRCKRVILLDARYLGSVYPLIVR